MTDQADRSRGSSDLRDRAEEWLRQRISKVEGVSPTARKDIEHLVRELEVHQIELAMQNEELRTSQARLSEARDRYSDLYNSAPAGYFTLDREGRVLEANLTGATLLGVNRAALMEKPLRAFLVQESADTLHCHLQEVFESRKKQRCELELRSSDGRELYVELESRATKDSGDNLTRCLTIMLDITERKLADKRLRDSEEKYRLLFSKEKDAIVLTDAETFVFLDVNEAAERLWGYTKDELLGMTALDVSAEPEESRRSLAAGARPEGVEVSIRWHRKKDGTIFPLETSAGSFHLRGRRVVCSIIRDITDRLASDRAVRVSQLFLQSTLNALSAHIAILDQNGIILAVNEAWRRFANNNAAHLPQDGIGLNYLEICDTAKGDWSEDAPHVAKMIRSLMVGERDEFQWEYPCHSPSEKRWFVVHGSRFLMDKHVRVVLAHEAITERKMADEALRQSEEHFRAIFEGATDCIWLKDRSLSFTHVNPAMCELLELPASRIVGRQSKDIYGKEIGRQLDALDARVLKGESIDLDQARKVRGTVMRFHDMLAPLRSQAGDIVGICGISRNITERQKIIEQYQAKDHDYQSPAMRVTLEQARVAAASDGIILLQGESGSGKDFLARWIHDHSKRSYGPYFSINCAAVSKELAESELFGHERGSFTGALGMKKGLLELAEGGTILLNEIGELPLPLQAKLLTFLDTRSFMRVGGEQHITVNARLIAATHRDLHAEVEEKRFLEPLFHRLNVFPIRVPPLRQRVEDLPVLVNEIMAKLASELHLAEMPVIDAGVIAALSKYEWPGNVRELRNVLERSTMLWDHGRFTLVMWGAQRAHKEAPQVEKDVEGWSHQLCYSTNKGLEAMMQEVQESLCRQALKIAHGERARAARLLKISRGTLYRILKKWEGKATDSTD